jgi:hypothetical protein
MVASTTASQQADRRQTGIRLIDDGQAQVAGGRISSARRSAGRVNWRVSMIVPSRVSWT